MDWKNEVVVITGGKGGLGSVLAEILGMRGVGIAVLDVSVTKEEEKVKDGIVNYYKCDVGNIEEVERIWARVIHHVCFLSIRVKSSQAEEVLPPRAYLIPLFNSLAHQQSSSTTQPSPPPLPSSPNPHPTSPGSSP